MQSGSGRLAIVYNGEVYNAPALRRELEAGGVRFRGHSDTEVVLAAIEQWGLEAAVGRFVGMFAFALWDAERRSLYLVRDRLGIKPLYYGHCGGSFLFASQIRAFRPFPGFDPPVDRDVLAAYLRHGYVPGDTCILTGYRKLEPGCILELGLRRGGSGVIRIRPYWTLDAVVREGRAQPFSGTWEEAVDRLEALVHAAVADRMLSDVPLGAFLSGGIDSSTVVALMQAGSSRPVSTFSIGFEEGEYDEAPHAREVAAHLGTLHTELYVSPRDAMEVIPQLPGIYDEPFADVSQIPTFLVSRLARRHVTVSLSGDGGDELFGGYSRYAMVRRLWRHLSRVPGPARRVGAALCTRAPDAWIDRVLAPLAPAINRYGYAGPVSDKVAKLALVAGATDADDLYRRVNATFPDPSSIVRGAREDEDLFWNALPPREVTDPTERMMFHDTLRYLPDDILVKVDRASMAVGLEARVPLLDHRVVAFAWSLPAGLRVQGEGPKWLLRKVLERHVPRRLTDRPKMGFGVPVGEWLRGPLRSWAEELLNPTRLDQEGFFHAAPIRRLWLEHLDGRRRWHARLWAVLMFEAWWAWWRRFSGEEDPGEVERWGKKGEDGV